MKHPSRQHPTQQCPVEHRSSQQPRFPKCPTKKTSSELRKVLLLIEPSRVYGQGVIRGVSQYALQKGCWVIRIDENRNVYESVLERIRQWNGDGIIARTFSKSMELELQKVSCPVVDLSSGRHQKRGDVFSDNKKIADMAADYLRGLGFHNFAFYSYGQIDWIEERRYYFRQNIESANERFFHLSQIVHKRDYINPLWSTRFETELEGWLKSLPKPVALWCPSDQQAVRVQERCVCHHIQIPEHIALLGVDNDYLLCQSLTPPLSSIQTDPVKIGFEAAQLLDNKMKGIAIGNEPIQIPPLGIISRQSTDIMALDDPDIIDALRIIREQACFGLTISQIVNTLNISSNTLRRRFLKYLGRTPEQEIKRIRIERSCQLLMETELTSDEIAELTGYGAPEYFAKSFLKETGLTPRQYRLKCHNG